MSTVQTFNCSFLWGGIPVNGLGESIAITSPTETTAGVEGIRGEGTLLVSKTGMREVTVQVLKDSPTIAQWKALFNQHIGLPLIFRRAGGFDTILFSPSARPKKWPDNTNDRTNAQLEFVFVCMDSVES